MSLALTLKSVVQSGNQLRLAIGVVPSGNYATNGDTVDLTALLGQGRGTSVFVANNPPLEGIFTCSTGYLASFFPGSTLANGLLKFVDSTTGNEVAAGAYPAGLAADPNIVGELVFDKLL